MSERKVPIRQLVASLLALAGDVLPESKPKKEKTKEEIEQEEARSKSKLEKAEAKRAQRRAKRWDTYETK